jgi:hypothetical protein
MKMTAAAAAMTLNFMMTAANSGGNKDNSNSGENDGRGGDAAE